MTEMVLSVLASVALIAVALAVILREIGGRWDQVQNALAYREASQAVRLIPAAAARRAA